MFLLFRGQRQIWTRINADLHGFDTTNWQQSSLIRVDPPLSASNAFAFHRQRQIWTRIRADLRGFDTTNQQQSASSVSIRVDLPLSASNAFAFSSPTADLDTDQSRFTWIRHSQPATIRFIRVHRFPLFVRPPCPARQN
jgi:hypothetical protein